MRRNKIILSVEEERKRKKVLRHSRTTVLIKVLGTDPVEGLQGNKRDDFHIEVKHTLDAIAMELDPDAYQRPKSDTGFCQYEKEIGARITHLVANLRVLGLHYTGGFWQKVLGKKRPVQTFQFSIEGEEIPIPEPVQELLKSRFGDCSVWCNLRQNREGKGLFRLDTINLNNPHTSNKPSRELIPVGKEYKLI